MTVTIHHGDCIEHMRTMEDASIDAIVTDPPAGISFMGKAWDGDKGGRDLWIAWMQQVAAEALRVAKPGAHALVWALPRTSHWTATAWENAGWQVRDRVAHMFGSGFPKSRDISKDMDRMAGAEREVIGSKFGQPGYSLKQADESDVFGDGLMNGPAKCAITAPATPEARQWAGWGTALKPSMEDWWLLRKPLSEKTVAANVLRHGTGGLNIDACRVGTSKDVPASASGNRAAEGYGMADRRDGSSGIDPNTGRWPANVIHSGDEEVLAAFAQYSGKGENVARFFYSSKASRAERAHSKHPTQKPLALMRYLVKLVCPPGGTVLDMFGGSGTTAVACQLECLNCVLVERDADYVATIRKRLGADFQLEAAD